METTEVANNQTQQTRVSRFHKQEIHFGLPCLTSKASGELLSVNKNIVVMRKGILSTSIPENGKIMLQDDNLIPHDVNIQNANVDVAVSSVEESNPNRHISNIPVIFGRNKT